MVRQMSLFKEPYRYLIDSSSLLSQKDKEEKHYRGVDKTLWLNIEEMIKERVIVSCSEIREELSRKDDAVKSWFDKIECFCFELDEIVQCRVIQILDQFPNLVDFKQNKSSADAFLIATAIERELTVVTEENKQSPNKIPMICKALNVDCINIYDLCERENWQF